MPDVRLVDLELIRRYSLAIRQESADAAEVMKLLDADRAHLERLMRPRRSSAASARARSKAGSKAGSKAKSATKAKAPTRRKKSA